MSNMIISFSTKAQQYKNMESGTLDFKPVDFVSVRIDAHTVLDVEYDVFLKNKKLEHQSADPSLVDSVCDGELVGDRPPYSRANELRQIIRAYESFKEKGEFVPNGTPIDAYPRFNVAQIALLKHNKILTLEQLSDLKDSDITHMGQGVLEMKEQAKLFLNQQKDTSAISKVASENALLKQQVQEQERKLKELTDNMAKIQLVNAKKGT